MKKSVLIVFLTSIVCMITLAHAQPSIPVPVQVPPPSVELSVSRDARVALPWTEDFETGALKSIEEVAKLTGQNPRDFIKAVIFEDAQHIYICFVQGDRELSEIKMKNLAGATDYWLTSEETIQALSGAEPGYAWLVGLKNKDGVKIGKKVPYY